jgi:type II secretory pathway pseudopilin PulG
MKKSIRTILGVTLLEIMLVLAIAAMVIVLSIRYYQSAASSSQANAILGAFQSITAAADNLSQGTGGYAAITQAMITNVVPASTFTSPWGTAMTFTPGASQFTVSTGGAPRGVCSLALPKLQADTHTATSTCTAAGNFVYIYVANP